VGCGQAFIRASRQDVFDFVCDISRWTEWDAFADEILETSDNPLVAGSTYVEREGKNDVSRWRVTESERPRRQVHVGDVPFLGALTVEMELRERDGGTDFDHIVDYEVMPRFRALGWLIEKAYVDGYARKGMARTHADAKRIIEAGA